MLTAIFQKYLTIKNVIFFAAVILFILLIFKAQDIALMFFANYVIASSLTPVVDKLCLKFPKISRNIASILVLSGALVLTSIFIVPIIVIAGYQIEHFAESFPQYLNYINETALKIPLIGQSAAVQFDISNLFNNTSGVMTEIFKNIIDIGNNLGTGFVYLITSIILIYYFMVDNKILLEGWLKLFPSNLKKKASLITNTITEKIGGYVAAQVVSMASVGLIMTIGLLLLNVKYAVILGIINAVLDIIPIVGPAAALIISLVVSSESSPLILVLIIVVFSIAQLSENSFVRPLVFGKMLDLHPVIIYLFLFLCAKYLGVIGVIFAPAIAATVVVLTEELYIKNLN